MSEQFVYFIQADENGPIKIGFTSDKPEKRLAQLQTGNASRLKLLGAVAGTSATERQLHADLSEWRLQGEWFEAHPTVLATIGEVLATAKDLVPAQSQRQCGKAHCSFCDACQDHTLVLVAGPDDIFICGQCIGYCAHIAAENLYKIGDRVLAGPLPAEMAYGG